MRPDANLLHRVKRVVSTREAFWWLNPSGAWTNELREQALAYVHLPVSPFVLLEVDAAVLLHSKKQV